MMTLYGSSPLVLPGATTFRSERRRKTKEALTARQWSCLSFRWYLTADMFRDTSLVADAKGLATLLSR
jgi:hypothetical protein